MPTTTQPSAVAAARRIAGATCLLLAVGGCAAAPTGRPGTMAASGGRPMTAAQFAQMQQALRGSAQARAEMSSECVRGTAGKSKKDLAAMAAVLDVDADKVGRIVCERLTDSVARGAITYEDFVAFDRDQEDAEMMRRVLRALRQEPGETMI